MNTETPVRVLIVDDSVIYRKLVRDILCDLPGVEVVGMAANGKIALEKIAQLQPDLLTLDLVMPEMDGLELLRQIKQTGDEVRAIVLSGATAHDATSTMAALELGAFDFIPKPDSGTLEEHIEMLRHNLNMKISAFACTKEVHTILHPSSAVYAPIAPAPAAPRKSDAPRQIHQAHYRSVVRPEVVAVGISTGGPPALIRMLPQLPGNLRVPMLIVQHMPPMFTKSLAEDLNRRCALTVSEAHDGQQLLPGHVLIAPGGKQMRVAKEDERIVVQITDDPPVNSCRPSVDYLFRSISKVYEGKALGVIMTGMGNDGALGCREMKQQGASIIAQDEASCVVYGMPKCPIEEGVADVVAPLDSIAAEIIRLVGKGA